MVFTALECPTWREKATACRFHWAAAATLVRGSVPFRACTTRRTVYGDVGATCGLRNRAGGVGGGSLTKRSPAVSRRTGRETIVRRGATYATRQLREEPRTSRPWLTRTSHSKHDVGTARVYESPPSSLSFPCPRVVKTHHEPKVIKTLRLLFCAPPPFIRSWSRFSFVHSRVIAL